MSVPKHTMPAIGTGKLVKYMRKSSALTQRELGKQIGLADTAISAYEREEEKPTPGEDPGMDFR